MTLWGRFGRQPQQMDRTHQCTLFAMARPVPEQLPNCAKEILQHYTILQSGQDLLAASQYNVRRCGLLLPMYRGLSGCDDREPCRNG